MMRFAVVVVIGLVACGDVVQQKSTVDAPPDPCPGAICECTAATEEVDCGAHAVCDESGGNRECKCAALYAEQNGACTFVGGPADPGFQDSTKWTPVGNGVMVDPAATGNVQSGELVLDRTALCEFSSAKQTVTMPPYDRADPLKVTITASIQDPANDLGFSRPLQIGIGGQWVEFTAPRNQYRTSSFCLGPAAFGGDIDIRIGATGTTTQCAGASTGSVRIDELKFEVAGPGECPTKLGIINGNFQLATGWLFPNRQSGAGQILPNIGENGSFAAELSQPNRCSQVTATGTIAIPSASEVEHPAIDLYWNGSSGARLSVFLGGKGIGVLNANGQVKHSRLCIPKWATGNITSIALFAQRVSDNNCGTALNRTFILDNMTIVDEPACGTLADITDPSFERVANTMGPMPGWSLLNGYVNDDEGSRTFILNSPGNANTGTGVLRTSGANPCVSVTEGGADFAAIVPPANGTAGPAVKFFARAAATNTNSESRAHVLSCTDPTQSCATFGLPSVTVAETGNFDPYTMCIPPNLIGRLIHVRLSTGDPDGGGCAQGTEEFAFWDDVQITTDPSCPAQ